jgi:cellulose synthase operon protein C
LLARHLFAPFVTVALLVGDGGQRSVAPPSVRTFHEVGQGFCRAAGCAQDMGAIAPECVSERPIASGDAGTNWGIQVLIKRLSVASAGLAALLLVACQQAPADHMAAAQAAIAAKDPGAAVVHLKNVIAAEPGNGEARLLLAQQSMALGEYDAAVADLRRARELKVPDDRVLPELAEAMLSARQPKLLIEQLANTKPQSPAARARLSSSLALAYLSLGNVPKARQAVESALEADSKSGPARLVNARVMLAESGRDAALTELEALLKQAPTLDEAWSLKGNIHASGNGELDQAMAAYKKALEINPKQFQALFSVVAMHMTNGDTAKARESLAALQKSWPDSLFGRYLQARLLLLEGKHSDARPLFATLRNSMPENVALLLASGVNELQLGAPIQAEALLAQSVSLDPGSSTARYFLARANLALGRPERATQALLPLVEAQNTSPEVLVVAAQAKLLQGDAKGASDLYARAEKFDSKDASVRTALAMARVARGEVDSALKELELISDGTKEVDADIKLIGTRLARNELTQALAASERLERKKPGLAATHELRGQILLQMKDLDGARRAFESALTKDRTYLPAMKQLTNLDVRQRNPAQAEKRLADALASDPGNASLMTLLAATKANTGAPASEVVSLLEKAAQTDSRHLEAWLLLIARHFQAGDLQAALSAGQTASTMIPDNVQLLEMIGRVQLRSGDIRQASSTFANIVRVAPRSASGYIGQAATLVAANELEAAAKVLQRLLDREPDSLDALRLSADVAVRRKRFDEAVALARGIQRRMPNDAAGFRLEGVVEQARNNQPAAAVMFRKALGKANDSDVSVRLYDALRRGPKPVEADQFAAEWTKRNPKDTSLPSFLGFLQFQANNLPQARRLFESVLAIDSDHVEALNNLALVQLKANDLATATELAQRALQLQPNRPELLDTMAQVLVAKKQYPKAVETLKLAINRATDAAPLRLALAKVYVQADDKPNALSELEKLVALGKSSATYAEARKLLTEQRRL